MEGVVREPSALGMTVASPPSHTAITELVVPRSIPTALAMRNSFACHPRRPPVSGGGGCLQVRSRVRGRVGGRTRVVGSVLARVLRDERRCLLPTGRNSAPPLPPGVQEAPRHAPPPGTPGARSGERG